MSCENVKACPCPKECPRHATCCECVVHHREIKQLPFCFFPKEGDKSYKLFCEYLSKQQ